MWKKRMMVSILWLMCFVSLVLRADENTDQDWGEFTKKDYVKARTAIQKCWQKSKKDALKQQKELRALKGKRRVDV